MAIFKIINKDFYKDPKSIPIELNYIYNKEKCIYKDSCNLFHSDDIQILTNQFSYIKSYYRKHSEKQLEHFVLSLDSTDEEHDISCSTLASAADRLVHFNFYEYQVAYAIHKPTSKVPCLHVHFIMNSVNLYTGHHFRLNKTNFNSFMISIAESLRFNNIALQGYSYFDEENRYHRGAYNGLSLYGKTMKKYTYY